MKMNPHAVEPEVVHHYTSAETLLKMVMTKGSESIWASDIHYLNDVMETEHCLGMMRERLPRFLEFYKGAGGNVLNDVLNQPNDFLWESPFVASFSIHRDSLPQWRSYCQSGNGVSIGFKIAALEGSTLSKEPSALGSRVKSQVEPVQYLKDEDWRSVDSILARCLRELREWHEEQAKLPADERGSADDETVLQTIVSKRACLTKHAAFENEGEFRLIAPSSLVGKLHFRSSRTTVIPYLEVLMPDWGNSKNGPGYAPFDDYFIADVVVGPAANPELTVNALKKLFDRKGVPVFVGHSKVPFRDL